MRVAAILSHVAHRSHFSGDHRKFHSTFRVTAQPPSPPPCGGAKGPAWLGRYRCRLRIPGRHRVLVGQRLRCGMERDRHGRNCLRQTPGIPLSMQGNFPAENQKKSKASISQIKKKYVAGVFLTEVHIPVSSVNCQVAQSHTPATLHFSTYHWSGPAQGFS